MNKKKKHRLEKKWWAFCNNLEEKIESAMFLGDGVLFIPFLPIWIILKTIEWLMYLLGVWILRMIPTTD